jgi:hypothetical protein
MRETHWTDDVIERPIFSTAINARGPGGNIFEIVGKATVMLRQIGIPREIIEELWEAVTNAPSYDAAVAAVERWFLVDR